ncbi:MAG: ABC transporter ATP-binding protein [Ignavibacteria bacterium]|nr:ABC transporter ATP-binding protein [Ignavibacteria bacterium]
MRLNNKKAISVENLSVYFGDFCVLENLNFSVEQGDFVTVVGPNGGGKTTLIKTILGAIRPKMGNILIFGENPNKIDFRYLGYVPQLKNFDRTFPAKAIEIVATGLTGHWNFILNKATKKLSLEALEQVGVPHLANQQINRLSGGELQRVYLARALVRNPKILVLDEPITGVDIVGENDFGKVLEMQQKMHSLTVFMVTHDWEYAYHHSSYVILLNKRIFAFDIPKRAFTESALRNTFGHIGHEHSIQFIASKND